MLSKHLNSVIKIPPTNLTMQPTTRVMVAHVSSTQEEAILCPLLGNAQFYDDNKSTRKDIRILTLLKHGYVHIWLTTSTPKTSNLGWLRRTGKSRWFFRNGCVIVGDCCPANFFGFIVMKNGFMHLYRTVMQRHAKSWGYYESRTRLITSPI